MAAAKAIGFFISSSSSTAAATSPGFKFLRISHDKNCKLSSLCGMSVGRVVFGESVVCGSGTVGLFEGLDDKLVVVHMGPADLRGRFEAAGGEQLFGPVHEAVRLGLEVEGDVVRGAEGGLFVTHHTEVEASTIVQPTAEAEVARHPGDRFN